MVYIHNRILVSLNKEIPTCTTTQINFEDIMLSKLSQLQKDKYCMISPRGGNYSSKIQTEKKRTVSVRVWGQQGELMFHG